MPVLPTFTDLGGNPVAQGGGNGVNYDATIAPARENTATAAAGAAGMNAIGRGLQDVAGAGLQYSYEQKQKADKLDEARANSAWQINRAQVTDDLSNELDPEAIRKTAPGLYRDALEGPASLIRDDYARERFLLANQPHVETATIAANSRADTLTQDADMANDAQTSINLLKTGVTAKTDAQRVAILDAHSKLIDAQVENGYITQTQAVQQKNAWAQNFAKSSIGMLPPDQRLLAIGGARDPVAVAKAFSGISETNHPEVLTDFFRKTGGAAIDPNEVPWCAAFADAVLGASGKQKAGTLRAADFLNYGTPTSTPSQGDVVVFKSLAEGSSGHVGFVIGVDGNRVRYIAGNDSGKVQESSLPLDKVAGFRVPPQAGTPIQGLNVQAPGAVKTAATLDADTPLSPMAKIISPVDLQSMQESTRRELDANKRQGGAIVKSMMGDDTNSIMTTGKPVEALTPDHVGAVFGSAAQADFVDTRQRAQNYYAQTNDFDTLPTKDFAGRLEALKPKAGEIGYDKQQQFYSAAAKRADEIAKSRQNDPAASVGNMPSVKSASEGVDYKQPETLVPLIKARLAAQDAIGIPANMQQPMTKAEATQIMAPVVNALPGTEGPILQKLIPWFQKAYGGQADKALQFALEQSKVDADTAGEAAKIFKKIGMGERPTQTDKERLAQAQANDAMAKAAANAAAGEAMWNPPGGETSMALGGASLVQPQTTPKPTEGTQRSDVRPPPEAIKALIQNPSRAAEFDALFGKGMAARAIKEYEAMTKKGGGNG